MAYLNIIYIKKKLAERYASFSNRIIDERITIRIYAIEIIR